MEKLNPSFEVVFQLKKALLCGYSAHQAIAKLNHPLIAERFGLSLVKWLSSNEKQQLAMESALPPTRQILMDLVRRALKGEPILKALIGFEAELKKISKSEIENHALKLQFHMLFPVLFFMLPAYLILLFGPILREFTNGIG